MTNVYIWCMTGWSCTLKMWAPNHQEPPVLTEGHLNEVILHHHCYLYRLLPGLHAKILAYFGVAASIWEVKGQTIWCIEDVKSEQKLTENGSVKLPDLLHVWDSCMYLPVPILVDFRIEKPGKKYLCKSSLYVVWKHMENDPPERILWDNRD